MKPLSKIEGVVLMQRTLDTLVLNTAAQELCTDIETEVTSALGPVIPKSLHTLFTGLKCPAEDSSELSQMI